MSHFGRKLAHEVAGLSKNLIVCCARVRRAEPEALHDLRIAIRRARSALVPMRKLPAFASLRKPLHKLKQVATKTNVLRDREVQFALIARLAPQPEAALAAWCHAQQRRQEKAMARLTRTLARQSLPRAARRLDQEFRAAVKNTQGQELWNALLARAQDIQGRLRQALGAGPAVLDDARQWHVLRLDCKRLRYLLQTCQLADPTEARQLAQLASDVQSTLGSLRDIELLQATLLEAGVADSTMQSRLDAERSLGLTRAAQSLAALAHALLNTSEARVWPPGHQQEVSKE